MSLATIVGFAASICSTAAFLPQVVRTWRSKSTRDISLPTYLAYSVGLFLWLIYGLMVRDAPLIVSNAITFVLAMTLVGLKLRHG